jgi:L-threonylcarbamoyladenylate synthase
MIKSEVLSIANPLAIKQAESLVKAGGLIAFPTDTVYGIGVSAFQRNAIDKIYQVKGRSIQKAIPILIGDPETAELITPPLAPIVQKLVDRFWPGPLTLVLPLLSTLPDNLSPTLTIGLRVPDHPLTRSMLRVTGPLAATSANLSGEPSASTADEVQSQIGSKVDLILDGGKSPGGKASTVLDCTSDKPVILRVGPLSWEDIQSVTDDAAN